MQSVIVRNRPVESQVTWPASIPSLLQRIYAARQVHSPDQVELSLQRLLPPEQLKNCTAAATLLADCLMAQQQILVVGDFDADGATSSALALRVLRQMGAQHVDYLVPNRFDYGYGLTTAIVEEALKRSPDLIITVDNGISSHAGVALARQHGVKVLITDHHLPGATLPDADVILNPNQPGDQFPSKALAGVGVVFYLLIALRQQLREVDWFQRQALDEPNLADYLDIVALGTVADVVPLDQNNRILVNEGLKRIRAGACVPGITALLEAAGRTPATIVAADLGFAVGPRLNAAGRLDDMSVGIECLLADAAQANVLAQQLDQLNRARRTIETDMKQEALQLLEQMSVTAGSVYGLALFDPGWHQGVIGILASRIKEKLHRPVIIFAPGDDGEIKGSARSIPGVHVRDLLEMINSREPGLIRKFGGHAMAAGLTLAETDFDRFSELFNATVREIASDEMLENVVYVDGALASEELNLATVELLASAGPWGQAFPEPVFQGQFRVISQRVLKERHFKLVLSPMTNPDLLLDGIAFNQLEEGTVSVNLPDTVELVYKLVANHYRGQVTTQLMIDRILT